MTSNMRNEMKLLIVICLLLSFSAFAQETSDLFYSDEGQWVKVSNTNCMVWSSFSKTNETVTWSGGIRDGKAFGNGTLLWFVDGKPTSQYEGGMRNGKQHGKGIVSYNGTVCTGEWSDGRCTSQSIKKSIPDGCSYEGEHTNGIPHGSGIMIFPNGNVYEGQFKFGKKDGFGEEDLIGGGKYIGEYKNDFFHGTGTCYYKTGNIVSGAWSNSVLVGVGDYTSASGEKFKVRMINGRYHRVQP